MSFVVDLRNTVFRYGQEDMNKVLNSRNKGTQQYRKQRRIGLHYRSKVRERYTAGRRGVLHYSKKRYTGTHQYSKLKEHKKTASKRCQELFLTISKAKEHNSTASKGG